MGREGEGGRGVGKEEGGRREGRREEGKRMRRKVFKDILRLLYHTYLQYGVDIRACLDELGCDIHMATLSSCHEGGQGGHLILHIHTGSLVQKELTEREVERKRGRGEKFLTPHILHN